MMKFALGPLVIDSERGTVSRKGTALRLAPKIVDVLAVLCAHAGEFVSKEAIIAASWRGGYADDTTLWQKISLLRRFLREQLGTDPIETLPRRGYRLVMPQASRRSWMRYASAAAILLFLIAIAGFWAASQPRPVALTPATQRAYNLGQYFLAMRTIDGARKAAAQFRLVIHTRPDSALGYAGLAVSEAMLKDPAASNDARTAVRLEPNSAIAQTSAGLILHDRAAFERALALDAQYAPAQLWYGEELYLRGEVDDAYAHIARAVDIDPSLAIANVWLARMEYLRNDAPSAITYARRALAFATSDEEDALLILGLAREREGNDIAARATFAKLAQYAPRVAVAATAALEAHRGERAAALADLQRARALPGCECAKYWIEVALVERDLGKAAAAARMLQRVAKAEPAMAADPRVNNT